MKRSAQLICCLLLLAGSQSFAQSIPQSVLHDADSLPGERRLIKWDWRLRFWAPPANEDRKASLTKVRAARLALREGRLNELAARGVGRDGEDRSWASYYDYVCEAVRDRRNRWSKSVARTNREAPLLDSLGL